jgi:hypothetical protein
MVVTLPEGRVRIENPGVITPAEDRGPNSGLLVVEVDGEPVCHLPCTAIALEHDFGNGLPSKVKATLFAGKSEITSRETKRS